VTGRIEPMVVDMSGDSGWGRRTIGFDLDMTLVDTSAATAHALEVVNSHLGTAIDVAACVAALGPPLRGELARWVPAARLDQAMRVFAVAFGRAVGLVRPLPGALALLELVRDGGGRSVVITGRRPRSAAACLSVSGLHVSVLVGSLDGVGKTAALRSHRVDAYVGDHPLDMASAVAAAVPGIGVLTGFHSADDLTRAGARMVLADLTRLPQAPPMNGAAG
jgi:phosphoglycolate phosphatase